MQVPYLLIKDLRESYWS